MQTSVDPYVVFFLPFKLIFSVYRMCIFYRLFDEHGNSHKQLFWKRLQLVGYFDCNLDNGRVTATQLQLNKDLSCNSTSNSIATLKYISVATLDM
jgi:hypothetical protein